jgi:dipeptidyl aminopeptidase/acylaminoacyl peptidase
VLGALALAASGSADAQAPERTPIAYTLWVEDGHSELFLIRSDGSGRTRLTGGSKPLARDATSSSEPSWSPDGARLAFLRAKHDRYRGRIATLDLASGSTRLLTRGGFDFSPAWSPDGTRIAFTRSSEKHGTSIFVVPAEGGTPVRLTAGDPNRFDYEAAWAPDGSAIAFSRITEHRKAERIDQDLFVMAPDGSGAHRIASQASAPAWSPDGSRIAFLSFRDRQGQTCFEECSYNNELYLMAPDGSGQQRLTYTNGDESSPAWSPDGLRIAFDSDRNSPLGTDGGGRELYSIGADGSCMTWLTNGGGNSTDPAWRPGVGAPSDPGPGCGATARPPTHDIDARSFVAFPSFTRYWLGDQFGNLLLSDFGDADPLYADCASYRARDCPQRIELQNQTICRRHPFAYGAGRGGGETGPDFFEDESTLAARRFAYRGTIAAAYPSAGGWDVYTGNTTVVVYGIGPRPRDVKPVIRALRTVRQTRSPAAGRHLPKPTFPEVFWRKLRRFERTYRRLGSEAAAARALRVTRHAVHDKLALGRLIRKLGATGRARC